MRCFLKRSLGLMNQQNRIQEIQDAFFAVKIPDRLNEYINDYLFSSEPPLVRRRYFLTNEVDDYLLQHFEDLGLYYNKKSDLLHEIEEAFGYYLKKCWENESIRSYINWARE